MIGSESISGLNNQMSPTTKTGSLLIQIVIWVAKTPPYRELFPPVRYPERSTKDFKPGDWVGYARAFLKDTGTQLDERWHHVGIVLELHPNGRWIRVQWEHDAAPVLVGANNIARVGWSAWGD